MPLSAFQAPAFAPLSSGRQGGCWGRSAARAGGALRCLAASRTTAQPARVLSISMSARLSVDQAVLAPLAPSSAVGSPPDAGFARTGSAAISPSVSPSISAGSVSPATCSPPPGRTHETLQLPGTPQQLGHSAAAMSTPPGVGTSGGAMLGLLGSPPFGSAFASPASGHVGFADGCGGLRGAPGGSPFGSFLSLLHGEGGDNAGNPLCTGDPRHGSSGGAGGAGMPPPLLFSSLPAPPSPVGLARAASVPGPQGGILRHTAAAQLLC